MNEEIDSIVIEEHSKSIENDEGLVDYEIKNCRDQISTKLAIDEAEIFVNKILLINHRSTCE